MALSKDDTIKARAFIQGAVYGWCIAKGEAAFRFKDLFGGVNTDWKGTPLMAFWHEEYNKAIDSGMPKQEAETEARKICPGPAGKLLKQVTDKDKRNFQPAYKDVWVYQWDGDPK